MSHLTPNRSLRRRSLQQISSLSTEKTNSINCNKQQNIHKANLNLNQQSKVITAHKYVHITVHYSSTQHSTEQIW